MSSRKVTLTVPDEFLSLCARDGVEPVEVLRAFIADLCGIRSELAEPRPDGYNTNGSDERQMAWDYYERVGFPWRKGEVNSDP